MSAYVSGTNVMSKLWTHNSKSCRNMFCSYVKNDNKIGSQFCTWLSCRGMCTVITWLDHQSHSKMNFLHILNMSSYSFWLHGAIKPFSKALLVLGLVNLSSAKLKLASIDFGSICGQVWKEQCRMKAYINQSIKPSGIGTYRKVSNIRRTKCQNLNASRLGLQLSLRNILKSSVKWRMKM